MTKLQVGDTVYELEESVHGAHMRDLKYLGRATVSKDAPKVTIATIQAMFQHLGDLPEGTQTLDLLGDDDFLANIIGVVWLARRRAGEDLTYDEAGAFAFDELEFIFDEPEADAPKDEAAEPAADPQ